MNAKQKELINDLYIETKKQFPNIDLVNISESPENPEEIWINVTSPQNDQAEYDLISFASEKSTDILLNYGYNILVMPS